jgi:Ca2+-binding RTX toxin-like protein
VLSITGTDDQNDYAAVSRQGASLVINVKNWPAADFSNNCTEGGGLGDWAITCPAANAKSITFEGKGLHVSFHNDTERPSEAHGGAGIDWFQGGTGADAFYGDADVDNLKGNGGDDTLDGGAGTDTLSGGPGTDIASWADTQNSVFASLDGVANDGNSGENENIPADVEGIQGGPYDDKLTGTGRQRHPLRRPGQGQRQLLGRDQRRDRPHRHGHQRPGRRGRRDQERRRGPPGLVVRRQALRQRRTEPPERARRQGHPGG